MKKRKTKPARRPSAEEREQDERRRQADRDINTRMALCLRGCS